MSLWTRLFGEFFIIKKPEEWVYIGKIEDRWAERRDPKNKSISTIMFFMTKEGDRKFEVVTDDPWIKKAIADGRYITHTRAKVWVAGGEFPPGLAAEVDTLGEMLNRLMDAKLTGKA